MHGSVSSVVRARQGWENENATKTSTHESVEFAGFLRLVWKSIVTQSAVVHVNFDDDISRRWVY